MNDRSIFNYYIKPDPDGSCVEVWSERSLPFSGGTRNPLREAEKEFRTKLRIAIGALRPSGAVHAAWIPEGGMRRGLPDLENFLFFNVGTSTFKGLATKLLRFERLEEPIPDPPVSLSFKPHHYARYDIEKARNISYLDGPVLAECEEVVCNKLDDLKNPKTKVDLWKSFKCSLVTSVEEKLSSNSLFNSSFAVQIVFSAPDTRILNLADTMKFPIDGFVSALHHYPLHQEMKLDALVRHAKQQGLDAEEFRTLLIQKEKAILGKCAVPRLGKNFIWSPQDHRLIAGEVVHQVTDHREIKISARLFSARNVH